MIRYKKEWARKCQGMIAPDVNLDPKHPKEFPAPVSQRIVRGRVPACVMKVFWNEDAPDDMGCGPDPPH
jgi:hypothetical protein